MVTLVAHDRVYSADSTDSSNSIHMDALFSTMAKWLIMTPLCTIQTLRLSTSNYCVLSFVICELCPNWAHHNCDHGSSWAVCSQYLITSVNSFVYIRSSCHCAWDSSPGDIHSSSFPLRCVPSACLLVLVPPSATTHRHPSYPDILLRSFLWSS